MQWGPNFIGKCGPPGVQIFKVEHNYLAVKYVPARGVHIFRKIWTPGT